MCGQGYHTMTWGGSSAAPESDPPNSRCDCGQVNRRDFLAYDSVLKAERERADRLEARVAALREAGDAMANESEALLRHFKRHTDHRCEIDDDRPAA